MPTDRDMHGHADIPTTREAAGFPPGWRWRTWPDDTVEQLIDDGGREVASIDWGSSPVEYTVGGRTHLFVPEYVVAPGSHVGIATGSTDVRAAVAEELALGSIAGQGRVADALRDALAALPRMEAPTARGPAHMAERG